MSGLSVIYKNAGNADPNIHTNGTQEQSPQPGENFGGFIWNHGTRCTNCDQLKVILREGDGRRFAFCLTYGNNLIFKDGDTLSPTAWPISNSETVVSWRWQGVCPDAYYREGVFI